ncbi:MULTISPECIES: DUF4003 family protein [Bacillaceae]|uniref:DUF4003 domain-containing protein n=1 Tax=Evansella alkalicola TaxID=745819 RepID=A0ABS6JWH9_9BACI|nr:MULTISPECIES: DUF4003 family protein [Bacillaceae]MBU9722949.1 DUF4003 domain-containing protein [Bacillus alkalicola]
MGHDLERTVNDYTKTFVQLKKKLRWHVSDERTLMMVSTLYLMKGKEFDIENFLDVSEYIKKSVGMFSSLKSSQRFSTAAMLDLKYEDPKEKFHEYLKAYEELVAGGFHRGNFTYIAALGVMTADLSSAGYEPLVKRAMEVYKGMKKEHVFLTGQSDYPLAVLLAQQEQNVEEMMVVIDNYYRGLNKEGFRKGNDLQFLSHILSLQTEMGTDLLIHRCCDYIDSFRKAGRRMKPMYYPVIGLLAIVGEASHNVERVMSLYERLNKEKPFRWHKDMNFLMAVNFLVKDKVEDGSLLSAGIQTTIEAIIQAQQAAMIAAMSGGAAASSSSN